MKARMQGAASLLITSLLLLLILVLTLSSYQRLFFQIKRVQNEVETLQQFWLAESALECAFSIISAQGRAPEDLQQQCLNLGVESDELQLLPAYPHTLSVTMNSGRTISKRLRLFNDRSAGVIQARSNLLVNGNLSFTPDAREQNAGGDWLCKLVSYQANLSLNGQLTNANLDAMRPPYDDFPNAQTCAATHLTQNVLLADVSNDDVDDLFMQRFDVPRADWKSLMYGGQFYQIPQGLPDVDSALPPSAMIENCGAKIVAAIEDGHDLIWLYGSCELKQSALDVAQIEAAITANSNVQGVLLVVHDGIFATNSEQGLSALIYQIVTEGSTFVPSELLWSSTESHQLTPVPLGLTLSELSYYQSGGFYAKGGYVLDAPHLTALFSADINGSFSGGLLDGALKKIRETRWQIGSWRDY